MSAQPEAWAAARSAYLQYVADASILRVCEREHIPIPTATSAEGSSVNWADWQQHVAHRLHLSRGSSDEDFQRAAVRLKLSAEYLSTLKELIRGGNERFLDAAASGDGPRYYDLSILPLTELIGGTVLRYCLPPPDYFEPHASNVSDPYGLLWAKSRADRTGQATVGVTSSDGLLLGSHKFQHTILMNVDFYCPIGCSDCYKSRFGTRELSGSAVARAALFTAPNGSRAVPPSRATILRQAEELVTWMNETARGSSVYDIIISGGEPLMIPNEIIAAVLDRLAKARRLRILRVCTGTVFLGLPMRIDDELLAILGGFSDRTGVRVTCQVHLAAPEHVSLDAMVAVKRLRDRGITSYSQIPIKSSINFDLTNPEATVQRLAHLNRLQVAAGVEPYMYIVDMHPSTQGFYVPIEALIAVWATLVESHDFPGLERPRTLSILSPGGNIILSGPTLALMEKSVDRAAGLVHYSIPRLGYDNMYVAGVAERFSFIEPISSLNENPESLRRVRAQLGV